MNYEKSFKKYIKNCIDSKVLDSQEEVLATCMLYRFDRKKQDLAETNTPILLTKNYLFYGGRRLDLSESKLNFKSRGNSFHKHWTYGAQELVELIVYEEDIYNFGIENYQLLNNSVEPNKATSIQIGLENFMFEILKELHISE